MCFIKSSLYFHTMKQEKTPLKIMAITGTPQSSSTDPDITGFCPPLQVPVPQNGKRMCADVCTRQETGSQRKREIEGNKETEKEKKSK